VSQCRRQLLRGAALGSLLAATFAVHAATVRLDDSGSVALQPSVQMQWRSASPKGANRPETQAQVQVQVRINTQAHAGRRGRVYMVLPMDAAGPAIQAEWQTQGRLLPGRLQSGERTLVFTGTLPGPLLEDLITVRLRSEGDWPANTRRLNFHFELDTE
jgi:hypothetical protein